MVCVFILISHIIFNYLNETSIYFIIIIVSTVHIKLGNSSVTRASE
jgi:hypothetical protein